NIHWLVKPMAGAGGAGIDFCGSSEKANRRRAYYQEFIEGMPCSAVFRARAVADVDEATRAEFRFVGSTQYSVLSTQYSASRVQLLGVIEQLIGEPWLNAHPFHWCGNIGPIPISAFLQERLQALGEALVQEFGLQGLFGVDFILRDEQPWPVEINPRYTGAVE